MTDWILSFTLVNSKEVFPRWEVQRLGILNRVIGLGVRIRVLLARIRSETVATQFFSFSTRRLSAQLRLRRRPRSDLQPPPITDVVVVSRHGFFPSFLELFAV